MASADSWRKLRFDVFQLMSTPEPISILAANHLTRVLEAYRVVNDRASIHLYVRR